MRLFAFAACAAMMLCMGLAGAQDMPEMPKPTKEHEALKQFAGEWDVTGKASLPNGESMETSGTESARMIGDFWVMGEHKANFMGMPFTGIMTLGYDAVQKKYVGTWVDSSNGHMWKYVGSFDEAGKVLTLDTEGPCPMKNNQIVKMQDVVEMKDANTKVVTSRMLDDGKWVQMMQMTGKRK